MILEDSGKNAESCRSYASEDGEQLIKIEFLQETAPESMPAILREKWKSLEAARAVLAQLGDTENDAMLANWCRATLDPSLRVAVFGEFSAGKSTLLNALLEKAELPAQARPTTGCVTELRYGEEKTVCVTMKDGSKSEHPFSELRTLVALDVTNRLRFDLDRILVRLNSRILRAGITLLDTPGLNDDTERTREAKQVAALSDIVIYVVDATQLLSGSDRTAVTWLEKNLQRPVIPIMTHLDFVDESEREDLLQHANRWAKKYLGKAKSPFLDINAAAARLWAEDPGNHPPPTDDFHRLREMLGAAANARVAYHHNRVLALAALTQELIASNQAAIVRLSREAEGGITLSKNKSKSLTDSIAHIERNVLLHWGATQAEANGFLAEGGVAWTTRARSMGAAFTVAAGNIAYEAAKNDALVAIETSACQRLRDLGQTEVPIDAALSLKESVKITSLATVDLGPTRNLVAEYEAESVGEKIGQVFGWEARIFMGNLFRGVTRAVTEKPCNPVERFCAARGTDWASLKVQVSALLKIQFDASVEKGMLHARQELEKLKTRQKVPDQIGAQILQRQQLNQSLAAI